MKLLMALLSLALAVGAQSLDAVKKEPDPEKRSERAIEAADDALKTARALPANGGSMEELQKQMELVVGAVELSLRALRDTGKRPYKLTRFYKRGELRTGAMLRSLDQLIQALAFDNRPPAEQARDKLLVMHEEYLLGVMSGK